MFARCLAVAATLLTTLTAVGGQANYKSVLKSEKRGIEKIVQLTARDHSAILFTVDQYLIVYVRDGAIVWIDDTDWNLQRWRPHPALSRDGTRVAFVSDGDTPASGRIRIRDMATGAERELATVDGDPGEISWSWDDSEILFFDTGSSERSNRGISAISVREGARVTVIPASVLGVWSRAQWYPMQWLRDGKGLVIELSMVASGSKTGALATYEPGVFVVGSGTIRQIDRGRLPAVSPSSDRIAYYSSEGVVAANPDGTGRTVLYGAHSSPSFKDDSLGAIVWSRDGTRLFFSEIGSDEDSDELHLLDLNSHRQEKFLSHTSIRIRGWS
jgi:Tol biopolymer transport system component